MDKYSWVAGYLEGEGWFGNKGKSVQIEASSTDLDIINKLVSLVGGHVYEVKKAKDHHKQAWLWTLNSWDAAEVMVAIKPMMGERRQKKIDEVLDLFWTSRVCSTSIVCPSGHQVIGDNRKVRSNGYKECRSCSRAASRAWKNRSLL